MVQISYHATEQLKWLSPQERADLDRVLENPVGLGRTTVDESSGKFVSRFGQNKRVVWEKVGQGNIRVLAVVSK